MAMLRVLIAIWVLVTVVEAAPKHSRAAGTAPELAPAEKLWTAAAAEIDPARAPAAWEACAAAFIQVADTATVAVTVRKDAAHAAVLAWRNAIALREPDLDVVPERLARPSAGAVIVVELPRQGTAQVPR